MQWDWIDPEGLRITVPALNMKSGRTHEVPITPMLARLLDATPNRGGGLVFPSEARHGGASPLRGWTAHVARLRRESGIEKVTLHDLRRTFCSKVTALGFGRDAMNRITNHKEGGIADVYDRHRYSEENKRIMETVARHIVDITEGREGNVIELRR